MTKISESFPDNRVCILGLGYVGLTLAVAMANVGFHVVGVEIRPDVVKRLEKGDPHFFEPGLADQMRRLVASGHLRVFEKIPADCDATVFFVTVGTPLNKDGVPRLDMIESVVRQISAVPTIDKLVILRSTVCIGATRAVVGPIMDAAGLPYDIAFCPERTVEGQALVELRKLPQIIGADSEQARMRAVRLFNCLTFTTVQVSSAEVAELIKLVDNTYRDISFAFANEIAELCDRLGIPVAEVISRGRLHYDRTSVPLPGPVGGPCLEKDPHILDYSARNVGGSVSIARAARAMNEAQPGLVVARIARFVECLDNWPKAPVVSVAGLAFKGRPVTGDLRGSMAIPLVSSLREAFPSAGFRLFDPTADAEEVEQTFGIAPQSSLDATIDGASLLIFATNHPSFGTLSMEEIAGAMGRPAVIYDFWNHFAAADLMMPHQTFYVSLGDGQLVSAAERDGPATHVLASHG